MLLLFLLFCQYKFDFLQLIQSSLKKHQAPWRGTSSILHTHEHSSSVLLLIRRLCFSGIWWESFNWVEVGHEAENRKHWSILPLSSPRHFLALAVSTLTTRQAYLVPFLSWLWPQSLTMSVSCLLLKPGDERGLPRSSSLGSHCSLWPLNYSSTSVTSSLCVQYWVLPVSILDTEQGDGTQQMLVQLSLS